MLPTINSYMSFVKRTRAAILYNMNVAWVLEPDLRFVFALCRRDNYELIAVLISDCKVSIIRN